MEGERKNETNNNNKKTYIVREFLYCEKMRESTCRIYRSLLGGSFEYKSTTRKYNVYKMQAAAKVDVMTLDWKLDQDE